MFYVKEQMNDAIEVSVEINDENVYCRCPKFCCEVQLDLAEVFADDDIDLFGTAVLCSSCTEKMMERKHCGCEQV